MFLPPPPPRPYCPECEKRNQSEKERFGFNIVDGYYYWTKIPEVKACCPVKVQVIESTSKTVTVTINGNNLELQGSTLYASDGVFYDCDSLESLTINSGVKIIGNEAFEGYRRSCLR